MTMEFKESTQPTEFYFIDLMLDKILILSYLYDQRFQHLNYIDFTLISDVQKCNPTDPFLSASLLPVSMDVYV